MSDHLPPLRCLVIPTAANFGPTVALELFTITRPSWGNWTNSVRDLVGGPFELIGGPDHSCFYCNEDGKNLKLKENFVATSLAHQARTISVADHIAGQVLVLGGPTLEGDDTSVPDAVLSRLREQGCIFTGNTQEDMP